MDFYNEKRNTGAIRRKFPGVAAGLLIIFQRTVLCVFDE